MPLRIAPVIVCLLLGGSACGDDTNGLLGSEGGDGGIPTGDGPLQDWLADGTYLDWTAEPAVHASAGPHFGDVRTFFGSSLEASLDAGAGPHPVGAASVKELYGDGDVIAGWAVMAKVESGAGGQTWYWYEVYDGSP